MTKFGQAEYNDFMARIFADKLDKLLKESEKQNYINRNTEDIYKEFASSKDERRRYRDVRICYWNIYRRNYWSIHNVSVQSNLRSRQMYGFHRF